MEKNVIVLHVTDNVGRPAINDLKQGRHNRGG